MQRIQLYRWGLPTLLLFIPAVPIAAQSFRVQCPATTTLHPALPPATPVDPLSGDPLYTGPSATGQSSTPVPGVVNGAVKCQQISGGDGYATMADGTQTYMFSFGPLSGMDSIKNGQPGTQLPADFNAAYNGLNLPNGLLNPVHDPAQPQNTNGAVTDPTTMMNAGVLNGNIPAPLMAFDEDDEFFLTLTNVGMIMRPDLFEQHTVHFHGYPNASSFYDGVPDASVAINIGGSFTYYYLAPDAGTYFWHCHVTPPEHLQMGMVGQLYVRPRQNRLQSGHSLWASLAGGSGRPGADLTGQQSDLRTACLASDILCTTPIPANNIHKQGEGGYTKYAYNDGDGSTRYDFELPIQIHGFDPNFHFVGMTFNPEGFADIKDKHFLLNGRSYPDTVNPSYQSTAASDGNPRPSQPMTSLITLSQSPASATEPGPRALLRISDLDVSEFQTLASLGIPMQVIAINARLLRDSAGNNLYYYTNSITLGGGESIDVILDATSVPVGTYFLFTPQLDHLSNDAENFGGLMTEIKVIP
jgi:FtsP/CotA-like multicopper oxidase with cupredoxin domain